MSFSAIGRSITKLCFGILAALFIIVMIALALFRFAPGVYLNAINTVTPYKITSSSSTSSLLPITLKIDNLKIEKTHPHQAIDQLVSASSLWLGVDLVGALLGRHNFWHAEISGADVDIQALLSEPMSSEPEHSEPKLSEPKALNSESHGKIDPLNIHYLLSFLNLKVSESRLVISDQAELLVRQFYTNIESELDKHFDQLKQNIEFALVYGEKSKQLSINGTLESIYGDNRSKLVLNLDSVDLTEFLSIDEAGVSTEVQENLSPVSLVGAEAPSLEWDWLNAIDPVSLDLSIKKIELGENQIETLEMTIDVDNSIAINGLQGHVKWQLSDDLWLQDKIYIAGLFTPTDNSGLNASLSVTATDSHWSVDGFIGSAALLDSKFSMNAEAKTFSLFNGEGEQSEVLADNAQWLPASLSMDVLSQKSEGKNIRLIFDKLDAIIGESDLSGSIIINGFDQSINQAQALEIVTKLNSEQLIFNTNQSEKERIDDSQEPTESGVLFSTSPVDWSWLDAVKINAAVNIKALVIDQRMLSNLNVPLLIDDNGLTIDGLDAELGDGAFRASLQISPTPLGSVELAVNAQASGIVLNDLHLVEDETLKGGDSRMDLSLKSNGSSVHDLASNLDGNVLFHIKKATIGNDVFELIGSDLVAELVTKLNPFLKSDPTTDLKCAVVNLNIKNGQIDVDKSIAMETEKMILVVDGSINLDEETLKLEIEPQSTGGIGLDAGSLVKFLELRGTLSNPRPAAGADGLLKSGVAIGAALSTGGVSLLVDGLVSKAVSGKACERALSRFTPE